MKTLHAIAAAFGLAALALTVNCGPIATIEGEGDGSVEQVDTGIVLPGCDEGVDEEIGADVTDLFNYLTGYSAIADFRKLLVAPLNLRRRLEADNADRPGKYSQSGRMARFRALAEAVPHAFQRSRPDHARRRTPVAATRPRCAWPAASRSGRSGG